MTVETLCQLFEFNTTKFNRPDLLVYRGKDGVFHNISTNEFRDRVIVFALGLRHLGVKKDTKVLFLSENRPEWHIADFACHLLAAVVVPIFPTLAAGQVEQIINHSDTEFVIVSSEDQLRKIQSIRAKIKKVRQVIVFNTKDAAAGTSSFVDILEIGREQDDSGFYEQALKLATPNDLATIIYTSGTTGVPKGVMLTHRNFIVNMLDCGAALHLTSEDRALSFLPLSHAFERMVDYLFFYRGLSIVYSASLEALADDLRESGPSIVCNVPRFYEKVKASIEAKASAEGRLTKAIFDWAMRVGRKKAEIELDGRRPGLTLTLKYALANRLIFHKIREGVGGKIRFFVSGGAPLSAEVGWFLMSAGLKTLEGYGLTETSPVIAVNHLEKPKFGTVGKPLRSVEVKISDEGEIVVRGPNVMAGYFKMDDETAAVVKDGWFHTGDIGRFDDEGYLIVTDRIKQLLITSVGKKVAPQPIEKEMEKSPYIDQILLIGDKRSYIAALVVPDFAQLQQFAQSQKISVATSEELVSQEPVVRLIAKEIDDKQRDLSDFEKIRKFRLLSSPFTIAGGELTPTMKIKRKHVLEKYQNLVEEMYAEKPQKTYAT